MIPAAVGEGAALPDGHPRGPGCLGCQQAFPATHGSQPALAVGTPRRPTTRAWTGRTPRTPTETSPPPDRVLGAPATADKPCGCDLGRRAAWTDTPSPHRSDGYRHR